MKRTMKITLYVILVIFVISGIGLGYFFTIIPPKNGVASLESDLDGGAPEILKWIVGEFEADIDFDQIPEILINNDLENVSTQEDFELRKKEMMEMFHKEVYGEVPDIEYEVTFEELLSEEILDETLYRKQIKMTITTEYGISDALILAYIPVAAEPVPAVVGLNFKGNSIVDGAETVMTSYGSLLSQNELESRRGERSIRWPYEKLVDAGYALFTVCANDFAPDDENLYTSRLISIFPETEEIKAIAAWSFGMERVIDYLVNDSLIDNERIVTFGHSRFGKCSLLTAANDERVALAIANGSGNTGAALSRGSYGETIKIINSLYPYWLIDEYNKYNSKEYEMPFDQHMLLASIAPRKVYV
ncbi:MAG: glucuronyl esterase domain-containing protein, partial [Promethearchaeota archaeon]